MSHYQPRNILVTGGAGFIGSNFIRHVLSVAPEAKVVNLDHLTYAGSLENLQSLSSERHHFVRGDINDRALVDRLLREHSIDTVVHFAAESHVDRSIAGPEIFFQTNVLGTVTLLEAARQYWITEKKWTHTECRFHHISTDEVYGSLSSDDPPVKEGASYDPSSPYSASKAGSDHAVKAYARTFGLPVTLTHCTNNYGPYQHTEKLIPKVISHCLAWKRIPVYGAGSNMRDWLYVEDHCRAIMAVLTRGRVSETYHIAGENEWENIGVVNFICHLMDEMQPRETPYKGLVQFVEDRAGHDWRYALDITKIRTELGWAPQETFESGIVKTLEFYLREKTCSV